MATTAIAAAMCRESDEWVISGAWVGDSTMWHLSADGQWTVLAGMIDEGSAQTDADAFHSTAVRPLPNIDGACAEGEFCVRGGAIFLMSDGVANPLHWSSEVRKALAGWWLQPPDPFSFAAQVGFGRRSHMDDRTVIGIWPDSGEDVLAGAEGSGAVPADDG